MSKPTKTPKAESLANLKPPWKPGETGNPGGRPKDPDWLLGAKQLPKNIAAKLWSKWLSMDSKAVLELSAKYEQSELSAIELGMCRALAKDIQMGEFRHFELGLSRIIGKIPDSPVGDADDELSKLNPEELMTRVRTAIGVLELSKSKDGSFKAGK